MPNDPQPSHPLGPLVKIFLPQLGVPGAQVASAEFEELASISRDRRHDLVDSPEEADACLFTECHQLGDPISLARIQRTRVFRSFRAKCFVYDQRPRAYCSLPGIYSSVPASVIRPDFQLAWGYHRIADPRALLDPAELATTQPDLLFSFVGTGASHPCRVPLLQLEHPRAVVKRVDGHINWEPNQPGYHVRRSDFARTTLRSKFVLCPRGRATSSIRFYEAMALGRVPVVIADDWVPPQGSISRHSRFAGPSGQPTGSSNSSKRTKPKPSRWGSRQSTCTTRTSRPTSPSIESATC